MNVLNLITNLYIAEQKMDVQIMHDIKNITEENEDDMNDVISELPRQLNYYEEKIS